MKNITRMVVGATILMSGMSAYAEMPEGFDSVKKWYTTFTNENGEFEWPAGCTFGSKVQYKENGGRQVVWSNTDPDVFDGFFITPKLKATAGETIIIEARANDTGISKKDGINVYLSDTRNGLAEASSRTPLLQLSASAEDETKKLTDDLIQYSFTIPDAGEYYIGFSLFDRGSLGGIYGLELGEGAHDLKIMDVTLPEKVTQNSEASGTVRILNMGTTVEKAGTYTITTNIGGNKSVFSGTQDIVTEHNLNGEGLIVPFKFRAPLPGTLSVKVEVKTEDGYKVASDTYEIEVDKEIFNAEKMVGNGGDTSSQMPLSTIYNNSESIALYTPEILGLSEGDKIKSISVNGYVGSAAVGKESQIIICYAWTDDISLEQPVTSADQTFDYTGMNVAFNGTFAWEAKGTEAEMVPIFEINFDTPHVYEAGKSLLLFFHKENAGYVGGLKFEGGKPANVKNAYRRYNDDTFGESWYSAEITPLHFALDAEARTVSGDVKLDSNGVADAVVRLISNEGDNVMYEGRTDAEGKYSVDVIQTTRVYDMEVHADGYGELAEYIDVSEASAVKDFDLRREIRISDDGTFVAGDDNTIVYFDKQLAPGYNVVTLPVDFTAEEVAEIFGESAKVYDYDADVENAGKVTVNFNDHEGDMVAGHPYLIYVEEDTKQMKWSSRSAVSSFESVTGTNLALESTTAPVEIADGMVAIENSLFEASAKGARAQAKASGVIPAFSGYFSVPAGKEVGVVLNNEDLTTGIEVVEIDEKRPSEIYDLNGVRVKNPGKGLYIINGKLVLVR